MGIKTNGGVGRVFRPTVDATGRRYGLGGPSAHLSLHPLTNDCRLYFTEESFDADIDYWTLVSGVVFQAPIEARAIWLRSAAGTVVEILNCNKG